MASLGFCAGAGVWPACALVPLWPIEPAVLVSDGVGLLDACALVCVLVPAVEFEATRQSVDQMTEPQAFKWIQRTAMDHRMTMREVADRILAESPGSGSPSPQSST